LDGGDDVTPNFSGRSKNGLISDFWPEGRKSNAASTGGGKKDML